MKKGWGRPRARTGLTEESFELIFEPVDDPEDTYRWKIVDGDQEFGGLRVRVGDRGIGVSMGFRLAVALDQAAVTRILAELDDIAASHPGLPMVVTVQDPLIRHRLRAAGYIGALRARLLRDGSPPDPEDQLEQLRALVPHLDIVAGRATRSALRLEVSEKGANARLELGMPRRAMLTEQVAASLDTAVSVKRAFAPLVDGVRRLHLRDVEYGEPPSRRPSGRAFGAENIVIDSSMVYVDDLLAERSEIRVTHRSLSNTYRVPWQHTPTDGVVAHELWHLFGDEIIGTGEQCASFNRALGEALGLETLEDAICGRGQGAVPELDPNSLGLAQQVSLYATTRLREATAEMFRMWWCSDGEHAPVVARFGELVEERLGRPVHPTTSASV